MKCEQCRTETISGGDWEAEFTDVSDGRASNEHPNSVRLAHTPDRCQQVQIRRLTDALHKYHLHPDFEYATTKSPRKCGGGLKPEGEGWEPNVIGTDQHSAWERFDFHEEEYWRRKVVAT